MDIVGFIAASAVLTLMPGPDILFVLAQGVFNGRRAAIAVALGLCSGLFVHTSVVALGLGAVVARYPSVFYTIKFAGVAYLVYLGITAWLERSRTTSGQQAAPKLTTERLYRRGVIMNLLNPKVILFFFAFLPQFIDPFSKRASLEIIALGGIFAAVAIVIFCSVAIGAGYLGARINIDKISGRKIATINALIYWALAILFMIPPLGK